MLRDGFEGKRLFDVGVDERQGGVWQLEKAVDIVKRVHEGLLVEKKVVFVLSRFLIPSYEIDRTANRLRRSSLQARYVATSDDVGAGREF